MKVITLEEADSTNSWLAREEAALDDMTAVRAVAQTQGRGQRGNSWESELGMNLTFSLLHRPDGLEARRQFCVSEAAALGIADMLAEYGIEAKVKWPNDIYADDRKICGILIENAVSDRWLTRCIIGAGVNVNQLRFVSDAPNPVSMRQLTGREYDAEEVMEKTARCIERRLTVLSGPEAEDSRRRQHEEFLKRLWRGEGYHPYRDASDGTRFEARIADIAADGYLTLERRDGTRSRYAFKEVEFILQQP